MLEPMLRKPLFNFGDLGENKDIINCVFESTDTMRKKRREQEGRERVLGQMKIEQRGTGERDAKLSLERRNRVQHLAPRRMSGIDSRRQLGDVLGVIRPTRFENDGFSIGVRCLGLERVSVTPQEHLFSLGYVKVL